MKRLSRSAREFYEALCSTIKERDTTAKALQARIREALAGHNLDIHLISARAKSPESALAKIRRKNYRDPAAQMTDQLAARVISYYDEDVDTIAEILRSKFYVDEMRSVDKRTDLTTREFGYKSVHLIARLRKSEQSSPQYAGFGSQVFEIQVRSILEHTWAEIDHEIRYKAGIEFPDITQRRFAALAGALEILEGQFRILRGSRLELIAHYRARYADGEDRDSDLDAARLVAVLELCCPNGASFLGAPSTIAAFPPRIEAVIVEALQRNGITTERQLRKLINASATRRVIAQFAQRMRIAPDQASHFAVGVIAAGIADPKRFVNDYPELAADSEMRAVLAECAARRFRRAASRAKRLRTKRPRTRRKASPN